MVATFPEFKVASLTGKPDLLAGTRGKVVLAVNVASRCGLTPQYTGLEALQKEFAARDFTVIGFPCNQFGGQEPGSAEDIAQFCSTAYGVSFPLSAKLDVNGPQRHALYSWLTGAENGHAGDISWNFEKFLIGRDGAVIKRFSPRTTPEDPALRDALISAMQL
ncbi:MAG: glutathione peroxidase [Pseudomonadota bacterium]